jgi:hypothetical protein
MTIYFSEKLSRVFKNARILAGFGGKIEISEALP